MPIHQADTGTRTLVASRASPPCQTPLPTPWPWTGGPRTVVLSRSDSNTATGSNPHINMSTTEAPSGPWLVLQDSPLKPALLLPPLDSNRPRTAGAVILQAPVRITHTSSQVISCTVRGQRRGREPGSRVGWSWEFSRKRTWSRSSKIHMSNS